MGNPLVSSLNWAQGLWLAGAVLGLVSVAAGAFGAHALKTRLSPDQLAWWELAARYGMWHAPALLATAGLEAWRPGRDVRAAGVLFLIGAAVFAGTLGSMAMGAPRWFGAITPIGGTSLIIAWGLLAWAGWNRMRAR
jgi:uncharacterized membrane protein YgdD (TMEM256/DUF423 family)